MIRGLLISAGCGLALSTGVTWLALAYARRRGLLDQPGRRRSHAQPTPRGGGIGIVAATLIIGVPAWCVPGQAAGWLQPSAFAVAVIAVALVGWRDDHAPLAVLPRIVVHALAALLVAAAVLAPAGIPWIPAAGLLAALAIVLIGFTNAHNFMDGIDGILGLQGAFVMTGYGLLATWTGHPGLAALAFATAAGCAGFLVFNLPPARIFMGDVGSGALGLTIGAMAAFLIQRDPAMLWACLILPSAFLADSGLTLARRLLGRQRWYAPHRQHLYQWLVRVKWSHARTDVAYMTWNLLIVAPLTCLAVRWPAAGVVCAVAAYAAAIATWWLGKRACLAVARRRSMHEPA